jgi:hypothetical protein
VTREATPPDSEDAAAGTLLVEEPRFAIVPEWVIDAAVSDGAFRLYSLLLRYGNGSRLPDAVSPNPKPWRGAFAARSTLSTVQCVSSPKPASSASSTAGPVSSSYPTGTTCAQPRRYTRRLLMGGGRKCAAQPRDSYRQTSSPFPLMPQPNLEHQKGGGG